MKLAGAVHRPLLVTRLDSGSQRWEVKVTAGSRGGVSMYVDAGASKFIFNYYGNKMFYSPPGILGTWRQTAGVKESSDRVEDEMEPVDDRKIPCWLSTKIQSLSEQLEEESWPIQTHL